MSESIPLAGHVTMELNGESWTFPLPAFHNTTVTCWGPRQSGNFAQEPWTSAAIERWAFRWDQYRRAVSRYGWLRRLPLRVPVYTDDGYDEDGAALGRSWRMRRLGHLLASRLIPDRPGPNGSHLVRGNVASTFYLIGTEGVTMLDNLAIGAESGVPWRIGA